jgi:signal transduction histidine kinase
VKPASTEDGRPWGPPWRHDRRTGRFTGPPGPGAFRRHKSGFFPAIASGIFHLAGSTGLSRDGGVFRPMTAWVDALLLIGPFALLWRRRFPVPVFAVAAAASIGFASFAQPRWIYAVAPGMALFNLAKLGRRWAALIGAAGALTAYVLVCLVFADRLGVPAGARPDARDLTLLPVALVVLIFLGGAARIRAQHLAEMIKVQAERARAEEEHERRQASEERLRMARELHDVLGHHLSLISVQAGVGLHLMDSRPEQAREALTAIKTASAEALREVRSVLDVLRTDDEAAPRQPVLGLSRLDDLTAGAGLPVTTRVTGDERSLPAEVDRAAYRIVQEALTNVRKHAAEGATAAIAVDYLPTALHLAIRNNAPPGAAPPPPEQLGSPPSAPHSASPSGSHSASPSASGFASPSASRSTPPSTETSGSGIGGMRARAQSLGGTLEAGAVDGGFLVSVLLPTPHDEPEEGA